MVIDEIKKRVKQHETNSLGPYAFSSEHAERKFVENCSDNFNFRSNFAHDIDRIMHSHAFSRYMDKTQVFFQVKNDHISRRALHVQMVSRIARTIGRCLGLNEDLIEAIALGHDIGHTPFGHVGEHALSQILQKKGKGFFVHNAQSVRVLQKLEKGGKGLNLTLPVLDGILGHNGEIEAQAYTYNPKNLNWDVLEENLAKCFSEAKYDQKVFPSTLEGCVVRVADIISYIGKDFEDAIALKIVRREDMPDEVAKILSPQNHDIIKVLCEDIIINSYGKNYITFSTDVFRAYEQMTKFNKKKIYGCDLLVYQRKKFFRTIDCMFDFFLNELESHNEESDICKHFAKWQNDEYLANETPEQIVTDYIAGMTDQYFINQFETNFMPMSFDYGQVEIIQQITDEFPAVNEIW